LEVSKYYGHIPALRSVTVSVDEGEVAAVLGPNGAGKSTFLKILATQISPSSGRVTILGRDPSRDRVYVRRSIGFLGHTSFMYDELSVEENLAFYGRMFSMRGGDLAKRISEVMKMMDLEDYRSVAVKKLSHGLRKRSDLARIFLHSPAILILDEPFSGLDEVAVRLLIDGLKSQEGKTILLSSHTSELLGDLCDRRLVFDYGRLIEGGGR